MAILKCPYCGTTYVEGTRFCNHCGAELPRKLQKDKFLDGSSPFSNDSISKRNVEIQKLRKENEKKEQAWKRESEKEVRREKFFWFAIVSFVFILAGLIVVFATRTDPQNVAWGNWLMQEKFDEISNTIWDSMVKEAFTFIIWLLAIVSVFIGFAFVYIFVALIGPLLLTVGLVFGIIQFKMNRKWWSVASFSLSILVFICGILIFLISLGA